MKNNVVIDFDTARDPALILGRLRDLPIDTKGESSFLSDLNITLNAIVTQIRALERSGINLTQLLKAVFKTIENGVFQADLDVRINNVSINARKS